MEQSLDTTPRADLSGLRRLGAAINRTPLAGTLPENDDEEERREARRRRVLQSGGSGDMTQKEKNETFDTCLEVCNNKLDIKTAWRVSLIDMVSNLMERKNSKFKNLKIAGSTLEASCKVYGMRVDSIHQDVLRMVAGLSNNDFVEKKKDVESDGDTPQNVTDDQQTTKPKKRKRVRKALLSKVTKNRDTLNARLDTMPSFDPIFAKLNSTQSSINASKRLMNNVLPQSDSKLLLKLDVPSWSKPCAEQKDYLQTKLPVNDKSFKCSTLLNIEFNDYELRPILSGYIISDKFEVKDGKDDSDLMPPPPPPPARETAEKLQHVEPDSDAYGVAFNIDGNYDEDIPDDNDMQVDVDFEELGEMTENERLAISNCRNLQVPRVFIADMRPLDSSIKLEYSYRPLYRISKFWTGPAHWKFKPSRPSQNARSASSQYVVKHRAKTTKRNKLIDFTDINEDLFISSDKYKMRKANVSKKWDPKKLLLPPNLMLDKDMFFKYETAPGVPVTIDFDTQSLSAHDPIEEQKDVQKEEDEPEETDAPGFLPIEDHFGEDIDVSAAAEIKVQKEAAEIAALPNEETLAQLLNTSHDSAYEIATSFEGAPEAVDKIIIPFAKRAKVIDMKNLKRSCHKVIEKNFLKSIENTKAQPDQNLPVEENEVYAPGVVKFNEVMRDIPYLLTSAMQESVSMPIAFYSLLHLANEHNFHVFGDGNLKDAVIRPVIEIQAENNSNCNNNNNNKKYKKDKAL